MWFKVDDKLHDHRKSRQAGKSAMGVWVMAGSWAMDNRTDGFVPERVLTRWGTRGDATKLVTAGLWFPDKHDGETGWRFHDWSRFQPSAAVIEATKAKEAEAGLRGNHRRWHVSRGITDPDCEFCYRVPDGPPDQEPEPQPDGVPESGANRPVPVPVPDTSGGDGEPSEPNSQTLLAEWLEKCQERPPGRVVGQVAREIKAMLNEGIRYETVRSGLAAWHRKSLHPSALASVVHEVQSRPLSAVTEVETLPDGRVKLPPLPPKTPWGQT